MNVHVYPFLPSFQLGLVVTSAVLLCYGLLRVTYNFFFHPLSRFPGPRGAACTRWWLAYMELVKRVSLSDLRAELHRKYGEASFSALTFFLIVTLILAGDLGDVVRISPNEVGALFRCSGLTCSRLVFLSIRSAPLCPPGRVQRDLQCAKQVGKGSRLLPCLRYGRSFLCAGQLPQIKAQQGAGIQFLFQAIHFRTAALDSKPSTGSFAMSHASSISFAL